MKLDAWRADTSRLKHHVLTNYGSHEPADFATMLREVELLDWVIRG